MPADTRLLETKWPEGGFKTAMDEKKVQRGGVQQEDAGGGIGSQKEESS
jgi:hypothetical protein